METTIKTLRTGYAVNGGDTMTGRRRGLAALEIAALSIEVLISGPARYRLATCTDGSVALACRAGKRCDYVVVYSGRPL